MLPFSLLLLQERLTLKHKNTSRWARRALKRGANIMDEGTKAAVAEQLRLGQELRRKVGRAEGGREGGKEGGWCPSGGVWAGAALP